jgi:folate-binding protein YgfZ
MLGDLRVLRTASAELLLDTERVALQALFDLIRRGVIGWDAELHKRTLQTGAALAARPAGARGDRARTPQACRRPSTPTARPRSPASRCASSPRRVAWTFSVTPSRPAPCAGRWWPRAPWRRARPRRRWRGSRRVARATAVDLDETTIPQEAGLNERAVSFTKGCYVGQETVARLFYKGRPNRLLRGLRLSAPVAGGTALRLGEREVGRVGSVAVSPTHGPIGLAIVRREAEPGAVLQAGEATAVVVELPFGPAAA